MLPLTKPHEQGEGPNKKRTILYGVDWDDRAKRLNAKHHGFYGMYRAIFRFCQSQAGWGAEKDYRGEVMARKAAYRATKMLFRLMGEIKEIKRTSIEN